MICRRTVLLSILGAGAVLAAPRDDDDRRDRDYDGLQALVDRTQSDLRTAVDLEHGNKQANRYRKSQDSLSDFDRGLSKGHYDKGKLDKAISELKDLLNHNTLQASTRDALQHDLEDLRVARTRHEH